MSLWPSQHPDCPVAYGGCTCICHRTPGVHHVMPCCAPESNQEPPVDHTHLLFRRDTDSNDVRVEIRGLTFRLNLLLTEEQLQAGNLGVVDLRDRTQEDNPK